MYFWIVLYPVNLKLDLTIQLQLGEFNFERTAYDLDIKIEQLSLNIDAKQFSDLLDFIKFQNYSKLYGKAIVINKSILNFLFQKDRCREYRELQVEQAIGADPLTEEQHSRLKV